MPCPPWSGSCANPCARATASTARATSSSVAPGPPRRPRRAAPPPSRRAAAGRRRAGAPTWTVSGAVAVPAVDDRAAVDAEQVAVVEATAGGAAVHDDLVGRQAQHAVEGGGRPRRRVAEEGRQRAGLAQAGLGDLVELAQADARHGGGADRGEGLRDHASRPRAWWSSSVAVRTGIRSPSMPRRCTCTGMTVARRSRPMVREALTPAEHARGAALGQALRRARGDVGRPRARRALRPRRGDDPQDRARRRPDPGAVHRRGDRRGAGGAPRRPAARVPGARGRRRSAYRACSSTDVVAAQAVRAARADPQVGGEHLRAAPGAVCRDRHRAHDVDRGAAGEAQREPRRRAARARPG